MRICKCGKKISYEDLSTYTSEANFDNLDKEIQSGSYICECDREYEFAFDVKYHIHEESLEEI